MRSCSTADDVAQLLRALAARPGQPALTFYRGREMRGRMTYGELVEAAGRLAGHFETRLGLRRGDRVLVLAPNSLEIPMLVLALLRMGAVVVPLNPTTGPEDWAYIARHCEARGLVATPELAAALTAAHPALEFSVDVARLAELATSYAPTVAPPADGLENEPAVVLYTSGTTGNPKGVALSQRNLLRNAWSMGVNFGLEGHTQFAVLPLYHAHALGFGLMSSLTTGGHLVFTDKLDPLAWGEVIRKESVAYTSVVPTMLPMLALARVHRDKVPTLKTILVSSAPLSTELARDFQSRTGIPLTQGWGLSEYTNFACCMPAALDAQDREALLLTDPLTSVGPALSGTEVQVVDAEGKALAEGEIGELRVRGHSLMLAYYRDPQATQAAVQDGWLRTGDQGYWRMFRGQPVFQITGRIKEIIIRDGEKHSPLAIEKKLLALAQVPEFEGRLVVLGYPDRAHGEEIGAYLEIEAPDPILLERLERAIRALPIEQRPKKLIHGATPIPRTHTGKIQRRKLVERFR